MTMDRPKRYEQKVQEIRQKVQKRKRTVGLIALPVAVVTAVGCWIGIQLVPSYFAIFVIGFIIIQAFTAKMAVMKINEANSWQKRQMDLLESERPFSKFQLDDTQ